MRSAITKGGFTLIELMVTIAVLAIIAMMAVPSFGTMLNKQNLNKSTSELIGVLTKARAKAAIERREVTVEIGSLDADTADTLHWAPSGNAVLDSGNPTIIFMPNGLVKDPTSIPATVIAGDTSFVICDHATEGQFSKTVSISRMGTIQQGIDGDCV